MLFSLSYMSIPTLAIGPLLSYVLIGSLAEVSSLANLVYSERVAFSSADLPEIALMLSSGDNA
jgi:hypothetical protein